MFSCRFPFYYELKIAFVAWLLSPYTKGSSLLYRKFVHPTLSSKEKVIAGALSLAAPTEGWAFTSFCQQLPSKDWELSHYCLCRSLFCDDLLFCCVVCLSGEQFCCDSSVHWGSSVGVQRVANGYFLFTLKAMAAETGDGKHRSWGCTDQMKQEGHFWKCCLLQVGGRH